jgi:hypothetical protein
MKKEMNLPMPELFEVDNKLIVERGHEVRAQEHLFDTIGWRWQRTVAARFKQATCIDCLCEDLESLGLARSAVEFLWGQYRKDKPWTEACYESDYMNEQIALEQAASMVNSFNEHVAGLVSAGTPLIYDILGEGRGPFGYEGHKPEVFLEAIRTELGKHGIRVMTAAEYTAEQARGRKGLH